MNKGHSNSTLFLCIKSALERLLAHARLTGIIHRCGVPFVLLIRVLSEPSIERTWSSTLSLRVEVKLNVDNSITVAPDTNQGQ